MRIEEELSLKTSLPQAMGHVKARELWFEARQNPSLPMPMIKWMLAIGDLPGARALAEKSGLAEIVKNIDLSTNHVRDKSRYRDIYSSSAPFGRPRTAGLLYFNNFDPRQAQLARLITEDRGRTLRVLDVGCADGSFLLGISKQIVHGIGVDLWSDGIREARKACADHEIVNLEFVDGYFEEEDLGGEFSAIVCGEMLEHCMDPVAVLEKCRNRLASGGVIIVTVPFAPPQTEMVSIERLFGPEEKEHVRYVSEDALDAYAQKAGLARIASMLVSEGTWTCLLTMLRKRN